MSPEPRHDQQAINFRALRERPTAELWLIELKLCLAQEGQRRITLEHVGSLAEYCIDLIETSASPEESREALIPAVERLLLEQSPKQVYTNKELCCMLLELIGGFTPSSGFAWTVRLLDALGMPKPGAPDLIGRDDTHLQALHALERHFLKLSDKLEDGIKKIPISNSPEMLATYVEILKKYADSPASFYAKYAQRLLGELNVV